jgi:hypothetical protein
VPGCTRAPTPESIRCRLARLHAEVDAANPARVEKGLLSRLRTAAARTDDAAAAATARKRRGKLRAAERAVQAFQQRLRTKPVRRALDDAVRAAWTAEARELANDLRAALASPFGLTNALPEAVAAPFSRESCLGHGRRDPAGEASRLPGRGTG